MSHEIRTPLNVILGYTEILRERLPDGGTEYGVDIVEPLTRAGARLAETIEGILDVSRMEVGAFKLRPTALRVADVIRRCVGEVGILAQKQGLRLQCRIDEPEAVVRFDDYCLSHALLNLLSNAIKFTPQGSVDVWLGRATDGALQVSVRDTGVGISPEYLPRMFALFSQEDASYTRRFEGSGLGLALVKRYAEMNGARVGVSSTKGRGSTFVLEFSRESEVPRESRRQEVSADGDADDRDPAAVS
jgi:signal transduction histidine kinase